MRASNFQIVILSEYFLLSVVSFYHPNLLWNQMIRSKSFSGVEGGGVASTMKQEINVVTHQNTWLELPQTRMSHRGSFP